MDSITTMAGNLCEPVELRFTGTGKAVANIRVARNRPLREDGSRPPAQFTTIVLWEDLAENMVGVPVGARVWAYGEMRERSYDKQDGTKGYVTELHARDAGVSAKWNAVSSDFIPKGQRQQAPAAQQSAPAPTEGELQLPDNFS